MTGPIALQSTAAVTERAKLEKASLTLYDPKPAEGGDKPGARRGVIAFQFNPKEVTIAKTVKWDSKPSTGAKKAGPPEFKGPEPGKLSLEMFFDATAKHDGSVVEAVETGFRYRPQLRSTTASSRSRSKGLGSVAPAISFSPSFVFSSVHCMLD